jgi:hypothetical protein
MPRNDTSIGLNCRRDLAQRLFGQNLSLRRFLP